MNSGIRNKTQIIRIGQIFYRTHIIALNKITSWYYRPVYVFSSQTNCSEVCLDQSLQDLKFSSNIHFYSLKFELAS